MRALACLFLLLLAAVAQASSWTTAGARALLEAIPAASAEGLDPARFEPGRLAAAISAGEGPFLDATADRVFSALAEAYAGGAVPAAVRAGWNFPAHGAQRAEAALARVKAGAPVAATLSGLLPDDPAYRDLRDALAATPASEAARRQTLAVNLERWRWLPRRPGGRLLWVNVPAFELLLLEDGRVAQRHRVIVGKPRTPTPQFAAMVEAVILNPDWVVPASIRRESIDRLLARQPARARAEGYVRTASGVTQLPGPHNQLGRVKLAMPNPYSIYLHDTQAKALFDRPARAFSHGCIRVQDPLGLARWLLEGSSWDRAAIDAAVAAGATTSAALAAAVPVWIVYFTAVPDGAGGVRLLPDIYGRDPAIARALARAPAAAPATAAATGAAAAESDCAA